MVEPVSTCTEYFDNIENRFIADGAKGVTATYMWELSGEGGGTWCAKIENGTIAISQGPAEKPNVTYQMDAGDYVKMVNGEINGTKAVMTRKLKVTGSILMAKKMNKFLPPRKA
jgi:putative sterol carrier protein